MAIEEPSRSLPTRFRDHAELLPANKKPTPRRYELDWLRVGIVLGAMVFHGVYEMQLYFSQAPFTPLTQVGYAFAIQWGLPLLFLIAGASAWLSLTHRAWQEFVKERVLRLFVPFVGCALTIIPISMYFASLIISGRQISFLQFCADYFQRYATFFRGNPLDHLALLWGNLWFIPVIFLLSVLALPLILLLKRPQGHRVISGCAVVFRVPGGALAGGLIFISCSWLLDVMMPTAVASALWLVALYALSFIAGVLLYADPSIEQAVARDGPVALLLALLCFVSEQVLATTNVSPLPHSGGDALAAILAGGVPWFGAIASLGLAKRFLSFSNRALDYLKEAVFPYFLLHMLVLSFFGYIFLQRSTLPDVLQGVAIISCSVLSLALLYEFVIKRNAFLRLVFGMKPRS